ncbi:hypothetical protein ABZ383_32085 [Streptomyces sp. NPDC005900]|uniref:hypothetical protein n=1 Tax=Streptomyces sp. NPDC005900 TaxID=3154569 RepID=UPI0033F39821
MTTPETAPTPDTPTTDQTLTARAETSGQWIAGLIATAMLDTVATPHQLPHLLFPDIDPDTVDRIWNLALPVGYRAGQLAAAPRFHRDTLHRLQTALTDAGYTAMARLTQQTRNTLPPAHPADHETTHHGVRGGHE